MKILAIDTSTEICGIGILEDEKIISEYNFKVSGTHSQTLMSTVDDMLKRLNIELEQIDAFAVALGPGMFTALRIGVATVKGLGLALNKPIVGVSTLDLLAYNLKFVDMLICPIIDARRNEVFTGIYRGGEQVQRITDYLCVPIKKLIEMLDEPAIFLGDGTDKYGEIIKSSEKKLTVAEHVFDLPRGANLAMISAKKLQKEGIDNKIFKDNIFKLTPLYIRKSLAEVRYEMGGLKSKRII